MLTENEFTKESLARAEKERDEALAVAAVWKKDSEAIESLGNRLLERAEKAERERDDLQTEVKRLISLAELKANHIRVVEKELAEAKSFIQTVYQCNIIDSPLTEWRKSIRTWRRRNRNMNTSKSRIPKWKEQSLFFKPEGVFILALNLGVIAGIVSDYLVFHGSPNLGVFICLSCGFGSLLLGAFIQDFNIKRRGQDRNRYLIELLDLLEQEIPPPNGCHHSLMYTMGKEQVAGRPIENLCLQLNNDGLFRHVYLNTEDFALSPEALVKSIQEFLQM